MPGNDTGQRGIPPATCGPDVMGDWAPSWFAAEPLAGSGEDCTVPEDVVGNDDEPAITNDEFGVLDEIAGKAASDAENVKSDD